MLAGDGDTANAAVDSGQGKSAYRLKPFLLEKGNRAREALFPIQRRNHQWLLALIYPLGDGFVGGNVGRRNRALLAADFTGGPQDLVGRFTVLGDHDTVKLHDPVQFGRHSAEEVFKIAVRTDGLRYPNQRFISFGQQVL